MPTTQQDELEMIWGSCIDWYTGDKQGAAVSIKKLPKLVELLIKWKDKELTTAHTLWKKQLGTEIHGMGFKDPNEAGQFSLHADGYNQAIEDILSLPSLHEEDAPKGEV
jgi:hypothetical protein